MYNFVPCFAKWQKYLYRDSAAEKSNSVEDSVDTIDNTNTDVSTDVSYRFTIIDIRILTIDFHTALVY